MFHGTGLRGLSRRAALGIPRVRQFYDYAKELREQVDQLKGQLATVQGERDELTSELRKFGTVDAPPTRSEGVSSVHRLIGLIGTGAELESLEVANLTARVESFLAQQPDDKLALHRDIGKAIFARSPDLYRGRGLPPSLVRFTYPATLAILLNTHCNAACFFCREADYKGTSVESREVLKLDTAIRHARVVDLTGWGEPFLYPDFEWVVRHILDINASPSLIQVTTNGSLLSKRWGELLAGKVNMIVVSLNAATPETYDAQMRYKSKQFTFDRVVGNLRAFLPMLSDEDRRRIDFHMVANTDNFREIPQLVSLAADLGVPQVSIGHYISAQRQYAHRTLWNVKQEYNDVLARGRELGAKLGIQVSARQFFTEEARVMGAANCMAPFESIFIEPSGKTGPCCFMGNERIENVYTDGFEAVWFSDVMTKLRHDRYLPPCKVCTVFSPFDEQSSHISATVLTEATLESARDGMKAAASV